MAIKVELVGADKAGAILEKALRLRDPELAQTRRSNAAKGRAKARKEGTRYVSPGWRPFKLRLWEGRSRDTKPMQMVGLSDLNRPISIARSDLYFEAMQAGEWHFSPDPIVISNEGYVLNGQHRLGAASEVDWSELDEIPQFVVVWGADKKTAFLMDEAKRSNNDRRDIALKYAQAA
jgi:hypothetical protein